MRREIFIDLINFLFSDSLFLGLIDSVLPAFMDSQFPGLQLNLSSFVKLNMSFWFKFLNTIIIDSPFHDDDDDDTFEKSFLDLSMGKLKYGCLFNKTITVTIAN